jgi:glucose/arabinose dehydrogenase
MSLRFLVFCVLAIFLSCSVAAHGRRGHHDGSTHRGSGGNYQSHVWSDYHDISSGTAIRYPSDVFSVEAGRPEMGSGKMFQTPDGLAQLAIYALVNDSNESPAAFLNKHLLVDKQRLNRKRVTDRFFAISGLMGDHKFHSKCNFAQGSTRIHCIFLQYPNAQAKSWNEIVSRISKSLDSKLGPQTQSASKPDSWESKASAPDTHAVSPVARIEPADAAFDKSARGIGSNAAGSASPSHTTSLSDQELGRRFHFDLPDQLSTNIGPSVSNAPLSLPYRGEVPRVPEGFTATPFATGLANPRRLLVLPNGDVFVAEQTAGYLTLLRDTNGDGRADFIERHAGGFNLPYGLAWRDDHLLVTDQDGIWQVPHILGALDPGESRRTTDPRQPSEASERPHMITEKGVFGLALGHRNRPLAIDSKSGSLFVGVGSSGNLGIEPPVKGTIQRFEADGSHQTTFASGIRNPTALAFHPHTGELFAVVQERDGLGDNLPFDYLIQVQQEAFYGWPYAYTGPHPQPGFAERAPEKVAAAVRPDLLFQAHSSVLDLVFYQGDQFPPEYRESAFVALRGSWNRSEPTGYKVVRVPFKDGRPEGYYENFVTGFWVSGATQAEVWGRPAALAIAQDGALFIADDTGGTIWRISYTGERQHNPAFPTETSSTVPQRKD